MVISILAIIMRRTKVKNNKSVCGKEVVLGEGLMVLGHNWWCAWYLKFDWNIPGFFRNACTKSGPLRFSQFSGCWLILSVCWLMSFDFPFGRLLGVRSFCYYPYLSLLLIYTCIIFSEIKQTLRVPVMSVVFFQHWTSIHSSPTGCFFHILRILIRSYI